MKDNILKVLAFNNTVRILAINSTNIVKKAQTLHETWPTASAALGRVLTIGSLMGSMQKNDERLMININGGGPIGNIFVESDSTGNVKGYVNNPKVYFKYESKEKAGKLNVSMATGINGTLSVTKDLNLKEPITSQVPLQTGEIAEDFAYFFALSEQVPSALGLGVLVDVDYSIKASGGFLLQMMPGVTDETITILEEKLKTIKSASTMINENYTLEEIIKEFTNDYKIVEKQEVDFICDCSKERFEKGLMTLNKKDLYKMIEEDGGIETKCHFCNEAYMFNKEDIDKL